MKKKLLLSVFAIVAVVACATVFAGCFNGDSGQKEFVIQYTVDGSTYQLTVETGMPYSLDVVPEKTGYTFTGLFDAEKGGKQYVSSSGASLTTFTDGKNLILYPQFKANEYTVILDYQGAEITGSRQFTVSYGSSLPDLPKDLVAEHKEFDGWYTAAECGGVRVADRYGLIPIVSVLTEQNFDLSGVNVTLYAGFEAEKHTVTFCFEDGIDPEEISVAYGTPVSKVVPKTRVNGNAVLTWSKSLGGEVWNGKIEEDIVLYAVEYAPVIELDSNGGSDVMPIVARAGSAVTLPIPTKDLAKFAHWEDMGGNEYTSEVMPSSSLSLKAVWQAKLVFDENGGSNVDDISVVAGQKITLPTPEREGFIFAGWYTSEKEQYTSTTMPSAGIKLKAGWYKKLSTTVNFLSGTNEVYMNPGSQYYLKDELTIDMSGILADDFSGIVEINVYFEWYNNKATLGNQAVISFNLYSRDVVSDFYIMDTFEFSNSGSYTKYSFDGIYRLDGNRIFVGAKDMHSSTYSSGRIRDYYAYIEYPDTTNLYI